ncbi:MAG: rubrerythrin family protein [Candidatus Cloacimonetes bacterium]|jgi:rubrerythrin|nr:rubrerythrin family protein [Candidatus Cloacimonadota bacterium]MCB5286804.1 rubrerythrin family protein [Candidatus Cloacimonadota bacterium]MCK9184152.1 rubrerythrin family protein [Candidatus Cloacimonadota bacterium]MCK9584202.1 rubrerythrin family protein [Candidatus Cloacimonadota bacterium]MDY0229126.1 rubrerythrin family protein [Candidatus Cloacimonadaceae bacterium]
MAFKDTRTSENLLKSFAGESQARMRYEYAAKTAKKQGFVQISDIFMETALNEKEHAKVFLRHLLKNGMEGEAISIMASYPAAWSETGEATLKNLKFAADGEKEEWTELYPMFAEIAEEEGYKDIATSWKMIAKVEKEHEKRFRKLYDNVKNATVFKKDEKVFWKCLNCGHIHEGLTPPKVCPACDHPQDYFEVHVENY